MLGSEYNWLVKFSRPTNGAPKVTLAHRELFTLAVAVFCFFCIALQAEDSPSAAPVVINIKDCGATGDGRVHLIGEWIKQGRYRNMRDLRREIPAVKTADWSVDEAAFELAKKKLPAKGGTIYFPAGRYVAAHSSWTIMRDSVRLLGDGADLSILSTQSNVNDALVLSPYRHGGWLQKAVQQFPFSPASGGIGTQGVQLLESSWLGEFHLGDLVFIRNGACRFDQDYGEFNEVSGVDENGRLLFRHPLARDYTLPLINWAGTVAEDFLVPKPGGIVNVVTSQEPGNFQPNAGEVVAVDDQLFEVVDVGSGSLRLRNPARGNSSAGTKISAGSKISKSRAVIKLTQSTRDFKAEKLSFVGRRKVLNLSNSYGIEFIDCRFVRDSGGTDTKGGLTIDGDGGRWARFTRCTLQATPPWGMQFARSFGGIVFDACTFENANVAFTEFNFDCEVTNCDFDFHGPSPEAVIIVGKSGGNYRITNNRIRSENAAFVFDSHLDIQSHKHRGEGPLVIRDNTVSTTSRTQVFRLQSSLPWDLGSNTITTH